MINKEKIKKHLALVFFGVYFFISYFLVILFIYLYNFNYRGMNFRDFLISFIYTISFLVLIILFYFLFYKIKFFKEHQYKAIKNKINFRFFSLNIFFISLVSMFYLLYKRGITLATMSYGEQLINNTGSGLLVIFAYAYIPSLLFLFISKKITFNRIIKYFICFILIGSITYFVSGGSRNVFLAGIISFFICIFYLNKISLKIVLISVIFIFIFSVVLAAARYGTRLDKQNFESLLYYFIDSISPIFTLIKILQYSAEPLYFNYFFNQFCTFIPREIWINKPILLETNALYITKEILNLHGGIIFSPSIVGSSIVMFGKINFLFITPLVSFCLVLVDKLIASKNKFLFILGATLIPYVFFLARENLEIFLYKIIFHTLPVIFFYICFYCLYKLSIFYKK